MKKSDKERLELEKRCLISLLEEVAEQYSDDGSIRVIGLEPEMRRVKLDLVVTVEDRAGLEEELKVHSYFKRVNVFETKRNRERFNFADYELDIGIKLSVVPGNLKGATIWNTTFTLLTPIRPDDLEELLEKGARKIRKGLYFIRENALIPIYLLISDEVEGESERERRLFKEYSRLCSERGSRGA